MTRLMQVCIIALSLNSAVSFAGTAVTVYKSKTCDCCQKYVEYLEKTATP